MITERDLDQAIAECHGAKNPNAETCLKLASYYTIKDHMQSQEQVQARPRTGYSFASRADDDVGLSSGTEFARAIDGEDVGRVLRIMDELMTALQVLHPRLYDSVIGRFS